MGWRTAIAEKIIAHKADDVLAVKENQGHLSDDLKEAFEQIPQGIRSTTTEKLHGRIEKGTCKVMAETD